MENNNPLDKIKIRDSGCSSSDAVDKMYERIIQGARKPSPYMDMDSFTNSICPSAFLNAYQITSMSDRELFDIIKSSYKTIIQEIMNESDSKIVSLFTNNKFTKVFSQAITSSPLTGGEVLCCNSIVYDYITSSKDKQNEEIKSDLLNMASKLNSSDICALIGFGIPKNIATYIVLSRRSSFNEVVNIKRMNFSIINSEYKMDAQLIIYIYERLFDVLSFLFEVTMLNPIPQETEDQPWITESVQKIDSEINIALLCLVESMPINSIYNLIRGYSINCSLMSDSKPKFSLRAIATGDYPRIVSVVDSLTSQGVYVP